MQNKTQINTVLLGVLLVLAIGFCASFINQNLSKKEQVSGLDQELLPTSNEIQNKLFDLFDTFPQGRDVGIPSITLLYPEAGLLTVGYATSQESTTYAVYDYKKDIMYKNNIGGSDMGWSETPKAFVGDNMLLTYSYNYEEKTSSLMIKNFKNEVVKTLLSNVKLQGVFSTYGKEIRVAVGPDEKNMTNYILNTDTLEFTKQVK